SSMGPRAIEGRSDRAHDRHVRRDPAADAGHAGAGPRSQRRPASPVRTSAWGRRRVAAVASIVLFAVVMAVSVISINDDLRRFLVQAPLILFALVAAWHALTRVGA